MQDRLVFLIGSPRSGSTLLSRVLGAHSAIFAPEEPHLITPMAHLGYYENVESAPYDPIITRAASRALVRALPGGEDDYLDALRAYSDSLYGGLFKSAGDATLLLDKTPAYALSLDFLAKLYPNARFIVLTRHPIAVWSSFVDSFFDGDDVVAHEHNPLLERYVPAIARFIRTTDVPSTASSTRIWFKNPRNTLVKYAIFSTSNLNPAWSTTEPARMPRVPRHEGWAIPRTSRRRAGPRRIASRNGSPPPAVRPNASRFIRRFWRASPTRISKPGASRALGFGHSSTRST